MIFTAHISNSEDRIQSVAEHSFNTAELCSKYCSLFGAESIGRISGLLHDVGKLCSDFDSYIKGETSFRRGEIDHSYAGAKYIIEIADKECMRVARLIGRVIISHHGLHDWVDENCKDYFAERTSNTKNYEMIKANISQIISEDELQKLLEKANDEYSAVRQRIKEIKTDNFSAAFYLGALERMIESALIDADRTDTASFMDNKAFPEDKGGPVLWQKMKSSMAHKLEGFADKTDIISEQRKSISDRCAAYAENDVHICRLIVPTGGGKTLSAMRFAIDYCLRQGLEKIIYTAPFMSILKQNSKEICEIAGEDNFLEHHSNALAESEDDTEEYKEYELNTERWDKPVIATTLVQLLNSLFLGKTSSVRRFHRLAKTVIIIDEVQSLPLKCTYMFNLAMNFLSYICGAVVVLCTATQPETDDIKYPVIIDENSSMTGEYSKDFEIFKRTEIIPCVDAFGLSYEETASFCMDKFTDAGDLLVIVNTKSSAKKLYECIKASCNDETEVIHLSTNMCHKHIDDEIERMKKLLKDRKPVICVTTQLIEAGVNISFKCVVRSLAGLDKAVQAAGRCNRHGENDWKCHVYIIRLKEEKLGNLQEIKDSQGITRQMIDSGRYSDISSPEAVSDYFRFLYKNEEKLSYSVEHNETLMNYLSLNKNRYGTLLSPTCSKFESQAFKTAGSLFKVIDDNTQDVIVPYNEEAEEIIRKLECPYEKISSLLRKAQQYTVSVYSGTERRLHENKAVRVLENGAVILDKSYYNREFGVVIDGAEKELLIF